MDNKILLAEIQKLHSTKKHYIKNSFGIKLIFQELRRRKFYNKLTVTDSQFYAIIKEVNTLLAEQLCKGLIVKLPYGLGQLETFKINTTVKFENNKLVTNKPVDWKKTLDLWLSDEECYRNKTLIRREIKALIKLHWNRIGCKCKNIKYFSFKPSRELCRKLGALFQNGLLDTFNKE